MAYQELISNFFQWTHPDKQRKGWVPRCHFFSRDNGFLTCFQLINKQNCTSFCFPDMIAYSLNALLILLVARITIIMIFNAHKYTLKLLLRYGIFNASAILLIEQCYSLQGNLLSCCFECNRNPWKFCINLKRVMSTEISRVRVINKETNLTKKLASIVYSPRYTASSLSRCSVTSVQDEVEEFVPWQWIRSKSLRQRQGFTTS